MVSTPVLSHSAMTGQLSAARWPHQKEAGTPDMKLVPCNGEANVQVQCFSNLVTVPWLMRIIQRHSLADLHLL